MILLDGISSRAVNSIVPRRDLLFRQHVEIRETEKLGHTPSSREQSQLRNSLLRFPLGAAAGIYNAREAECPRVVESAVKD